jgi:predicted nucleotidyltransferase
MGLALGTSAKKIGCSERTLRRYINGGLLRGRRIAGGQLELSHAEEAYLRGHRALLGKLMAALRTERDVRLAVLFGSTATGEDTPLSDVDLLIVHRRSGAMVQARLCIRLRRALGTPVDVVMLEQAEAQPALLADVMREGRVLVDRDDLWVGLQRRRDQILAAGAREDEQIMIDARATFAAARERLAQRERGTGTAKVVAHA